MKDKQPVQSYHRAGMRNCLGWCNQKFYSIDKTLYAFCDACRTQKEKAEKDVRKTRTLTDNSLLTEED